MEEPFRVIVVGHGKNMPQQLVNNAPSETKKKQILECVTKITFLLMKDPMEVGEPLFNLRNSGLQIRLGIFSFLAFTFGVDDIKRHVFVNRFLHLFS